MYYLELLLAGVLIAAPVVLLLWLNFMMVFGG